ncbi:MAG: carboxypeptidase-like regulatory domain-containing protein [Candidatus Daviesbacteria bacterium]
MKNEKSFKSLIFKYLLLLAFLGFGFLFFGSNAYACSSSCQGDCWGCNDQGDDCPGDCGYMEYCCPAPPPSCSSSCHGDCYGCNDVGDGCPGDCGYMEYCCTPAPTPTPPSLDCTNLDYGSCNIDNPPDCWRYVGYTPIVYDPLWPWCPGSPWPEPCDCDGGSGGDNPNGWHDDSRCDVSYGWACDASDYNQSLEIKLYADGSSTPFGTTIANIPSEQGVIDSCGGTANHRFDMLTPNSLKDGNVHSIATYATNVGAGSDALLSGSPKQIQCAPVVIVSLSGTVTDSSTGLGIDGITMTNTCNATIVPLPTTAPNGSFSIPNVAKGELFCLRFPTIPGYTGPNRTYEWQVAGLACAGADWSNTICELYPETQTQDLAVDNLYNFTYTPRPTSTPTPTLTPTLTATPTPTGRPAWMKVSGDVHSNQRAL